MKISERKVLNRILNRVVPHLNGCWIYQGYLENGYGRISYKNRLDYVHRIIFKIHYPNLYRQELFVCHHCDNPACVNPEHLFIGTPGDNTQDMINKGRHNLEIRIQPFLTEDQVKEIRILCKQGMKQKEVAPKFNVGPSSISNIIRGKTHRNII